MKPGSQRQHPSHIPVCSLCAVGDTCAARVGGGVLRNSIKIGIPNESLVDIRRSDVAEKRFVN